MSYFITKTINGRFTYWWGKNNKWEGLRNNAKEISSQSAVDEEIRTIRRLNQYDKTVHCNGYLK